MGITGVFGSIDDVLYNGLGGLLEHDIWITLEYKHNNYLYEANVGGFKDGKYSHHVEKNRKTLEASLLDVDSSLLMGGLSFDSSFELRNLDEVMKSGAEIDKYSDDGFGLVARKKRTGILRASLVYGGADIFKKKEVFSVEKGTFEECLDVLNNVLIPGDVLCGIIFKEKLETFILGHFQKN